MISNMIKKEMILKIIGGIVVLVVIVLLGIYSYQIGKAGEVNVKTEKTEYQTGETLKVKIKNKLGKTVCFSSCYPYYFEKQDGEWQSYDYENCPNSNLVEKCIKPRQVKAYEIVVPSVKEGLHRLALPACLGCNLQEKFREDKWLYSNDFVIK